MPPVFAQYKFLYLALNIPLRIPRKRKKCTQITGRYF